METTSFRKYLRPRFIRVLRRGISRTIKEDMKKVDAKERGMQKEKRKHTNGCEND